MSSTQKVVAAIVTNGVSDSLTAAVDAVMKQTQLPFKVYIVDVSKEPNNLSQIVDSANTGIAEQGLKTSIIYYSHPKSSTFGDAINHLVHSDYFDEDSDWLWMLHSDSVAQTDCLENLYKEVDPKLAHYLDTDVQIGVVGAKQIDPKTQTLQNVGWKTTQFGRRIALIGEDQVDQGQYSEITDVLAVSLNGALVSMDAFDLVAGINGQIKLNDSLDFGRRVHLAGYRVVIAAGATVEHTQQNFKKSGFFNNRRFDLIYRLATSPLYLVLPLWIFFFISSIFRAIRQLYSDEKGTFKILAGSYAGLFSLSAIFKSRRLNANAKTAGKATAKERNESKEARESRERLTDPKHFYASNKDVNLVRKDERMAAAAELWADFQPTLLEAKALKNVNKKRRVAFGATFALLVVLTVVHFASSIPELLSGGHFVSSNLAQSTANFVDSFNAATSGFTDSAFGFFTPVDPVVFPLALLTIFTGSMQITLDFIIFFAIILAGLAAWAATGAATRNNSARMIATLCWISLPVFTNAIDEGRIGVILAHILTPLVPYLVSRGLGKSATDFDVGLPKLSYNFPLVGIVLAFIFAAEPVLAPLFTILFVVGGFVNRRFWFALILPTIVNIFPLIWVLSNLDKGSWQFFLGDLPLSGDAQKRTVFSVVFGNSDVTALTTILCAIIILVSAVYLLIATRTARIILSRFAWFVSISCITVALFYESISSANASALISVAYLGFIVTILIFHKQRVEYNHKDMVFYIATMVIVVALSSLSIFVGHQQKLSVAQDYEIPAVAKKINQETGNPRILVVNSKADNSFEYQIVKDRADDFIYISDAAKIFTENTELTGKDAQLRQAIASIMSGPSLDAVKSFNELGIQAIFLPAVQDQVYAAPHIRLLRAIDATPSIVRIIEGEDKAFWRIPDLKASTSVAGQTASSITWDNSNYEHKLYSPVRIALTLLILLSLVVYALLSLPFGKRRVIKYDV
ncbi:hypothetical protein FACS1894125_2150 [Actinomycetota bacterium]|nr:hypothetical protein FACS1894125_2150 [Actinomycetota bacterium]